MKYKIATCLWFISWHTLSICLDNYTNHSFMFVQPIFDSISINQSSWHDIVYRKQKIGGALQVVAMYEQSFENLENPAYFLFNYKKELYVAAGSASSTYTLTPNGYTVTSPAAGMFTVESFDRDILGQWISVPDTTSHPFTLKPTQEQVCAYLEYSHDLNKVFDNHLFKNWFINISAPITWIQNNIGFSGNKTLAAAFEQSGFDYVKIVSGTRDSTRLTQVHLALGTRYIGESDTHVITSSGIIVPLVEQGCGTTLFEPVQGFNAHFVINAQAMFQFPIIQKTPDSTSRILFFFDFNNNFLARNHQLRTYDIKNKPFSRYMKLLDRHTNQIVQAMNVLTLRSRVEPFNIVNLATGFRFKYLDSIGEIGYELWAHGSEVITPDPYHHDNCCGSWEDDRYGIAFVGSDGQLASLSGTTTATIVALPANALGMTASNSTINFVAPPDGITTCCPTVTFTQQNKYLRLIDLDRVSPASQPTITHRAFASVGFGEKGPTKDYFANIGLFIEATQNNAALCFWGGWIKAGLSF